MLEFGHVVINQDFREEHLLAGRQHLNLATLCVESEPVLWIAVLVWRVVDISGLKSHLHFLFNVVGIFFIF